MIDDDARISGVPQRSVKSVWGPHKQRTAQARQVGERQIVGAKEHVAGHELQLRVAAVVPQARHHLSDEPVALHPNMARFRVRSI